MFYFDSANRMLIWIAADNTELYKKKDVLNNVKTIGKLEQLFMDGEITEEEYRERKAAYVETILELYCLGILSKEQMQEKLNQ